MSTLTLRLCQVYIMIVMLGCFYFIISSQSTIIHHVIFCVSLMSGTASLLIKTTKN